MAGRTTLLMVLSQPAHGTSLASANHPQATGTLFICVLSAHPVKMIDRPPAWNSYDHLYFAMHMCNLTRISRYMDTYEYDGRHAGNRLAQMNQRVDFLPTGTGPDFPADASNLLFIPTYLIEG